MFSLSKNGAYQLREAKSTLKLVAVGDVIPSGRVETYFKSSDPVPVFGETSNLFIDADIVLYNLETPLFKSGEPIAKCGANFKCDPNVVNGLKAMNFGVAALANNHIMDYGKEGLKQTIETLDKAGINWHGAGLSQDEAQEPLYFKTKGTTIAFLNFAEGEFSKINSSQGGAAYTDVLKNKDDIKNAKKNSDLLVVSVHAGKEFQHFPSPHIQDLYREYISFGADLVIGHHPHIPQGIEHYKNGLIAYSFGDFMFEHRNDPGTCITFALEIQLGKEGVNAIVMHPIKKLPNAQLCFLSDSEKQRFIDHMNRISAPLSNRDELKNLYEQGILRHFDLFYLKNMARHLSQIHSSELKRRNAGKFLYNMFDCDSHREALRTAFRLMYQGKYEKDPEVQAFLKSLYECLEVLGGQDSLEPWRKPKSFFHKLKEKLLQLTRQ